MDEKNNNHCDWFDHSSIWHYLALYAGFGGATLAVLWQGISRTFHISIGMASLIVAIIMIVFSFFYDRSQIHIGTIIYQLVYSLCVDLFANAHVYSTHLWVNALIMLLESCFLQSEQEFMRQLHWDVVLTRH